MRILQNMHKITMLTQNFSGMFVVKWSLEQIVAAKKRDAVLLKAWASGANIIENEKVKIPDSMSISPSQNRKSYNMPFYSGSNNKNNTNDPYGHYRWLCK